ncbi:MAG: hypothetical protein HY287_07935 [Planctomycetes bacterium]|nr:hypothetical protein [Planctomycetota bacterium]
MSQERVRVLNVGQCDFDHGNILRVLSEAFNAEVERAGTIEEAFNSAKAEHFDLVLVNRVLDVDGSSGFGLICRLQSHEETRRTPVALVSNLADAQDAALALGAQRGFGKDALFKPETRDRLASLLGLPK